MSNETDRIYELEKVEELWKHWVRRTIVRGNSYMTIEGYQVQQ